MTLFPDNRKILSVFERLALAAGSRIMEIMCEGYAPRPRPMPLR